MNKIQFSGLFICFFVGIITTGSCYAQKNKNEPEWNSWPKEASPLEVGRFVTERFLQSPHAVYNSPDTKPPIPYFEVCAWDGALTYAGLAKNDLGTTDFPKVETGLMEGEIAFRQHSAGHTPGPNWPSFIQFANRYLK